MEPTTYKKASGRKGIKMKTEFLKELGLTDEQVKTIMAENGKDIEAEKAKTGEMSKQLETANNTIKELQDAAKKFDGTDPEALKKQISDLQEKYDKDLTATKTASAVEVALMKAGAKNVKAVRALLNEADIKLDGDKLLGLEAQLEALKKENDFLFATEGGKAAEEGGAGGSSNTGGARVETGAKHGEGGGSKENYNLRDAVKAAYENQKG